MLGLRVEVCHINADLVRDNCGLFLCLGRLVSPYAQLRKSCSAGGKSLDRKFVHPYKYLEDGLRTLRV
jgi:hypothetical protein